MGRAAWLAEHHDGQPGLLATPGSYAPLEAISADAIAAYVTELETRGLASSTIKKDRAAINRFAKYLHALRAIDANEILMIDGPPTRREASTRDSLDEATWQRVQKLARARLSPDARQRSTPTLHANAGRPRLRGRDAAR